MYIAIETEEMHRFSLLTIPDVSERFVCLCVPKWAVVYFIVCSYY